MQFVKRDRLFVRLAVMAVGLGLTAGALGEEEAQNPTPQGVALQPSSQAPAVGAPAVAVPQAQTAYQTVNTVECVTVPVTQLQTQYRTEYRTENVPVTRMVPETVNESRTITRFIPQQETINKQVITNYVCEPVTTIKKCYRPIPVTKNVTKTLYQTYCTTEIVTKEITNFVPECVTETVPVTKTRKVVEQELTYVTQKVPVTSMVPVVSCAHTCGHKCGGGGCGACGGVTTCVGYQSVTSYACQQVPVMRPTVKCVPETTYVQRTRTKMMPVEADRAGSAEEGEPHSLSGHADGLCHRIRILRRSDHQNGQEADLRHSAGVCHQDGSGIDDRRRSDRQVPSRDRNRLETGRGLCALPGSGDGHDHADADRRHQVPVAQPAPAPSTQVAPSPQ